MKEGKKGVIVGAVTGAVAGGVATSTNLNLLETIGVACIIGIIVAIIIRLIWK